jgi:hypothetical protein
MLWTMNAQQVSEARAALDALAAVDFDTCDRPALDDVLVQWRMLRSFTDACDIRIARRSRQLAAKGSSEPSEAVLAQGGRRPAREARAAAAREKACDQLPCFEDALAAGTVSTGHVDALAAATHGLDDAARAAFAEHSYALLRQAKWQSVEAFTRECHELARIVSTDEGESRLEDQKRQCRVRRWVDRVTGMHIIHAELDPESGTKVWTAIDGVVASMRHAAESTTDARAATAGEPAASSRTTADTETGKAAADAAAYPPLPGLIDMIETTDTTGTSASADSSSPQRPSRTASWDWWAAQALVELLTGARAVDKRVPEVAVHIDWPTLVAGLHDRSLCETSDGTLLPPATVRRLCCEAEIFPVVVGSDGEVLDQGRAQRLANREQRRALRAMYRTCAHPGCDVEFDRCEIHHVRWWEHGGRTDLANLVPLCSRHHHLVHEGGWMLRLTSQRVITLIRPDGTVQFTGSTVDRPPGAPQTVVQPRRRRSPTAA